MRRDRIATSQEDDNSNSKGTAAPALKPVVFCCGGPGSGKGALLEGIAKLYDYQPISTGDVLRAEVSRGTDLGKRIGAILAKGQLVPAEVAVSLLKQELQGTTHHGVLLDGFPRSKEQRDAWYEQLGHPTGVIDLMCSEEVMEQRIMGRAKDVAANGGAVRSDDNAEVLRKRFRTHQEQCVPVMEEIKNQLGSKYCTVDANKSKEAVREAAKAFLATLQIQPVE